METARQFRALPACFIMQKGIVDSGKSTRSQKAGAGANSGEISNAQD